MALPRRRRLACLLLTLIAALPARAELPSCLRFQASGEVRCASEPDRIGTPRLQYEAWKKLARSGQHAARYFTHAGAGAAGEPLFQENGVGVARTAEEWLASRPGTYFFDSARARNPRGRGEAVRKRRLTPPITLRLSSGEDKRAPVQGLAYFNAARVRLVVSEAPGVMKKVHEASEPFFDLGLDLDHDGVVCGERGAGACCPDTPEGPEQETRCNELATLTNSRWDVELDVGCDPRVTACASDGPVRGEPWPPARPEWQAFVALHEDGADTGEDPRFLRELAHEPFLQWAMPGDAKASPPIASFARERRPSPARSSVLVPPGGEPTAGYDRESGSLESPVLLQGLVYNEGRVILGDGVAVTGVLLSGREVVLEGRATLAWSSDFARRQAPAARWMADADWCHPKSRRARRGGGRPRPAR